MQDVLSGKLFTTRGGALVVGGIAAALAALLLVVYLRAYRNSVEGGSQPVSVMVAKSLIPKGTSGTLIGQKNLFQVTTVPKDQLKDGAVSDPSSIRDRVTAADVFPGQQLTLGDFTAGTTNALPTRITGAQRAIAIPVDSAHGLLGQLTEGDHVDVYVGFSAQNSGGTIAALKLLGQNLLVLAAPSGASSGTGSSGNVFLRVLAKDSAKYAFAADNGRLWFVLRPQVGARPTPPSLVTVATVLAGTSPLVAGR